MLDSIQTLSTAQHAPQRITLTQVADALRPGFMARLFGTRILGLGEAQVFNWMDRLSPDYGGGYWEFFELSNGGLFLAPEDACCPLVDGQRRLRIRVDGNGYEGLMSPQAAGLLATSFALNHLLFAGHHHLEGPFLALTDFICEHPEGTELHRALD